MTAVQDLDAPELAALLHFYADSGVDWLVEDQPIDRIAQFADQTAAKAEARTASGRQPSPGSEIPTEPGGMLKDAEGRSAPASPSSRSAPARPASVPPAVAVPDGEAVAAARHAAEGASSLAELKTAVEVFTGCNLKNGARSTVFASGDPASRIMVVGAMPNADDDRDGIPFSGRQGQLLDRMLGAIGLSRDGILLTNIIPWRPPGNRMPSPAELEICRPFLDRQIALADPGFLLLLGNFPARFFFGGTGTIHSMRGEWQDLAVGRSTISALATLHPQELLAAPANKTLAWQDLLMFKKKLDAR